jgi:hypothetical protein
MDTVMPRMSAAERQDRINVRAAQLLNEAFEKDPPANAWWGEREVRLRDECLRRAEQEIDALGFSYTPPDALASSEGVDWSGDPRENLRRALAEKAEAERLRDNAGETAMRAAKRVADAERELEHYADLNARIDAWNISLLKSPTDV